MCLMIQEINLYNAAARLMPFKYGSCSRPEENDIFVKLSKMLLTRYYMYLTIIIVNHKVEMYYKHGGIQGRYLGFFKAHGPVFYHV